MAGSGLPGAFLAPAQLVSPPWLGSNAGHRRPGSWACRKSGEGPRPRESDHPPAPTPGGWDKRPGVSGQAGAQAQPKGSRVRVEGSDSQNSKCPLGQGRPERPGA